MLLFSLLFGGIGFFVGGLFVILGFYLGEPMFSIIGAPFAIFFPLIAVIVYIPEYKEHKKYKEAIRFGRRIEAKIVDYTDGSGASINGRLPLNIVCDCNYNGEQRKFFVSTGEYDESKFPLGSRVELCIYENNVFYVKDSLRI